MNEIVKIEKFKNSCPKSKNDQNSKKKKRFLTIKLPASQKTDNISSSIHKIAFQISSSKLIHSNIR